MTQATLSVATQPQTATRQYLTTEQTMTLVMQVKRRNELLKSKKEVFTLEEKRLCIQGERAFNTLIQEYQSFIWWMVRRFAFTNRMTTDEMYQYAVIAFERAVKAHNPKKPGRQRTFLSWVYLHIRSKFLDLMKAELRRSKRVEAASGVLKTYFISDGKTPLSFAIEEDLKAIIHQETEATLPQRSHQILREFYLDGRERQVIARNVKTSRRNVDHIRRESLKVLRTNPRIQELAEAYLV